MPVLTAARVDAVARPSFLRSKSVLFWASALTLLYLVLAFGDARSAIPWCDEAWLSNPALTYLRHGYLGTPILTDFGWGPPESLLHIARRTYWIMPLHMLLQIGWYRLFGYSLLSLRSLSIVWGAVGLGALAAIISRVTADGRTVCLAVAILATDYFFLTRAVDGRMDMMAAALMLLAVALYLWHRPNHFDRAVWLAGLCAAGSFFTHPVGGFFTLCALGFLLLFVDRSRLRPRHLLYFGAPFAAIGLLWFGYIVQDIPAFRQQMAGNAAGRWKGITNPFWTVYGELWFKYFQAFGLNQTNGVSLQHLRLLVLAGYIAGVLGVAGTPALRNRKPVRAFLWITAIFVFGGMLFDGAKRWYYLIYVVPCFAGLLAIWIVWLWDRRSVRRPVLAGALALFFAVQIGGTAYRIKKNDFKNEFLPAARFVERENPHHELINGEGELGFALGFPNYLIDDVSLGYFSHQKAKLIFVPTMYWALWLGNMKDRDPAVSRHIEWTLAHDYTLVYDTVPYRIYERKD